MIDAITSSDLDRIEAHVGIVAEPCIEATGPGFPAHVCEPDEAVGTTVGVFGVQTCGTGSWSVRASEVRGVLRPLAEGRHRLIGVVEFPDGLPTKRVPRVKEPGYVVVFASHTDPPGATTVFADPRGKFNQLHFGCFGFTPHEDLESWTAGHEESRQIFP